MADKRTPDPIRGKTLQWTFTDGPAKGTTYEHHFGQDGMVEFHTVDASSKDKAAQSKGQLESKAHYGSATVAEGVCAVSYKGESGYTLTTILNFTNQRLVAFASNDKEWFEQQGTFEVVRN
jgi:hypothetical protein